MPGSPTTPGWTDTRVDAPVRVAFRDYEHVGTREFQVFAAQWLAYALPCRRFAVTLAGANARLGADVDRYSFIVVDLHHQLLAGLCRRTIILEFGLENRALQLLVLRLLKAQADLHPNQYLMRGTHAAIERVVELLRDGYTWAIETDIYNCYPSFDGEKVPELLPIPKEVTRRVLLCGTYTLLLHSGIIGPADQPGEDDKLIASDLFADARRGLPQGSAASPLAVEMLLAPMFHKLPAGSTWTGYSDNFLAMGKTKNDAESMTSAFRSALKAHPAGPFWPNPRKVYAPGEPIEFLGHRIQRFPGMTRIDPTADNLDEFARKMQIGLREINKASSKVVRMNRIRKLQAYVFSWTAAFKLCADVGIYRDAALKRIATAASKSAMHG